MTVSSKFKFITALVVIILGTITALHGEQPETRKLLLQRDWEINSTCVDHSSGESISTAGYSAANWHHAEVPTTVVAALVADKTYPDPTYAENLKSLPGMNYDSPQQSGLDSFFANQDMPKDSPFRCAWWFRNEFTVPTAFDGDRVWLHFDALNYRANIWLNGKKIADAKDVAGTFRIFKFEISKQLLAGEKNALAVEIFAPEKTDLGMTWVDWNPTPSDKNMGLWKDVYLSTTGAIALSHPFVTAKLSSTYTHAALTVTADLQNASDQSVSGNIHADIEGIHLSQRVTLAPQESRTVTFSPEEYSKLKLDHPRLWWPYQMGKPELYAAKFYVELDGHISDTAEMRFGVREVSSELTDKGYRLFRVNGRKVLIRGAAWAPDFLLRWSETRAKAALQYTRDMNLNAIRLEGRMERDEFFDMADSMGILIMPGWTCCDMWEKWDRWTDDQTNIATASLTDQVIRLRNHPSVFVWLYGSDNPPPKRIETMYLKILADTRWPNPAISNATAQSSALAGSSGMKMTGPYEIVPPNYWLTDTEAGGAYGFNTETSPGPAIPTLESLKKFIPADHLWPIDEYWNFHAGGDRFKDIDKFVNSMSQRYGKPQNLEDFLRKSQAMNYEAQRAMFEAYGKNKYASTGVIQWMLNNAWPSIIWHLYDYYLVPAGGYYGTRKACEPIHAQYSYDDNSVVIVNSYGHAFEHVKVTAKMYSVDAIEKQKQEAVIDVSPDSSTHVMELPAPTDSGQTYFLKLTLQDAKGEMLSSNFYWLSTKPDVLDWKNRLDSVYTPESSYADLTALEQLKDVPLTVSVAAAHKSEGEQVLHIHVKNPSASIAFMTHMRITEPDGEEDAVPVFWSDNYVSLMPGEETEIAAHFIKTKPGDYKLQLDGWNVTPMVELLH